MNKIRYLLLIVCLFGSGVVIGQENSAEPGDYLELDLAREIDLAEQAKILASLMQELATLPPGVIEILLNSTESNAKRLETALAKFQKPPAKIPDTEEPEEPRLTAKEIVYVEVPTLTMPGMVLFAYEGRTYSASLGGSFSIRWKRYTIVAIKYLSASQIEVSVRTKARITRLRFKT